MSNRRHNSARDFRPPLLLLVVEEDPHVLQTHSGYLESAGLWVVTRTNPRDGLSCVRDLLPDLLITAGAFGEDPSSGGLSKL
jgi:hypothetical protein